eukprot:TRINITY_DN7143_c0_g2_i8.p1 TRINITY_DN7143_c0_g2~~TRINITY_DN7143_c0_g2_i8.p1  ORF type:complete len:297 (-),score=77.05 TRINITY_DN7143_c0_g2_i8:80-970(-)
MKKVADSLQYYIIDRLTCDPGWKGITAILSDASVPGEGEHKLMAYIRHQHSQEGYNSNTRHCIYGLDADLIMLGLATHEPHFAILREDVLMNNPNQQRPPLPPDASIEERFRHQPFQFLLLNVLREYLEVDMKPIKPLSFPYDFERLLDDFVFLCFFVGNDFLPHLPSLEIREGAISTLCELYSKLLPDLDGYLTEHGHVNMERVEEFIDTVWPMEDTILMERERKDTRMRMNRIRQKREDMEFKVKKKFEMRKNSEIYDNFMAADNFRSMFLDEEPGVIPPPPSTPSFFYFIFFW